jgi:hypothetical protein
MASVDAIISVAATVIGSILVAGVINSIHSRRQRKIMLAALRSEITANLTTARRLKGGYGTVSELSYFQHAAHSNALSGGALASLKKDTFEQLSRVYDLMAMHDKQASVSATEWIPRDRGPKERIVLIESILTRLSARAEQG